MAGARKRYLVGVDVGGTRIRYGILGDADHVLVKKMDSASRDLQDPLQAPMVIRDGIEKLCKAAKINLKDVKHIGIGAPGEVNTRMGAVVHSPNFPRWQNLLLDGDVERFTGVKTDIYNDADAAAMAEAHFGWGQKHSDFVMITLGTGLGASVVIDRRVLQGANTVAGELGHTLLFPGGRKCGCGNNGCVEAYVSGWSLEKAYTRRTKGEKLSGTKIAKLAAKEDAIAVELWRELGINLGFTLANVINLLDPSALVIRGGLTGAWKHFYPDARRVMLDNIFSERQRRTPVLKAKLGAFAGMVGAALFHKKPKA